MIVNDDRKVLTHYGVKGMRWGVRKEREAANRRKAKGIVRNYKNSSKMNISDLTDAQWMSMKIGEKLSNSLTTAVVPEIFKMCLNQKIPTSQAELKKLFMNVAKNAALRSLRNEISGKGALKRYTAEGKKDSSKKQYRRFGITPNRLLGNLTTVGISIAPAMVKLGKVSYKYAKGVRMEQKAKDFEKNMKTVYDDGYMAVLERVQP